MIVSTIKNSTIASTPHGQEVLYTFAEVENDYEYGGRIFSRQVSKITNPITITAPQGQSIKSLKIYDKEGNFLRDVTGFSPGETMFSGIESLHGTKLG